MMIATDIRPLAHVYTSYIPFRDQIWFLNVDFNPLTWPLTHIVNSKGHERKFIWLGILITIERDIKSSFELISIESYGLLCLCSRQSSWMSGHVGFIIKYGVKLKNGWVRRVGNVNFRRNWYQVWLSSPSWSKVMDENLVGGGHFGFHAPVTLCHGFSKSTSWIVERHGT